MIIINIISRTAAAVCIWLILVAAPALASQATLVTPSSPLPMTGLASFLNSALLSIGSCNSGNSAPANGTGAAAFAGECWINTTSTPWVLSYYDGASWVQVGTVNASTHAFQVSGARIQLTGNTTFYVNQNSGSTAACGPTGALTCSAGSDSNNCLTTATACLTTQHAVNVILQTIDLAGFNATVSLAHGSSVNYGGVLCNTPVVGRPTIFIQGDTTNAAAVTAVAPNASYAFYALDFCALRIDSITLSDQGSALQGVRIGQDGIIDFVNAHCAAFNSSAQCIFIEKSGSANLGSAAGITIDGCGQNFLKMNGGAFNVGGVLSPPASVPSGTISISTALACSDAFINASGNSVLQSFASNTFAGSGVAGTTGVRAKLSGSAYLNAGGTGCNSIFPGNSPCQITQSAQDDASDPLTTPWPLASGGTGIVSGSPLITGPATSVSFGSAGDNTISVPLPSGFTRLCSLQFQISGASGSLTSATFQIWTAAGGTGTAVTSSQSPTVSTATDNAVNNAELFNSTNLTTGSYLPTSNQLFFRVGSTVAQTANVQAQYRPCP